MRILKKRCLHVMLAIVFVTMFGLSMSIGHAATKPTLNKTNVTITGAGTTYTLKVNNQPANTTLVWSSSKPKIATVNGLGQVTAVKKGTTTITCKVTYSNKTTVKLTSKVTVKIPATAVKINNAKLVNNAHEIMVGETYDFNRTLTPKTSSDKSYWIIQDEDIATVNSSGVVTALKPGVTQLQVRSSVNKKSAMDALNTVTDSINIIVSEPVASVESAQKTSSKTVTIKFTHAMTASTLVDIKGEYNSNNVSILGKTKNNVKAADLGKVKATLSSDGKTYTLTATNDWDGVYVIRIESDVTTQRGVPFKGFDEEYDFSDATTPGMVSCITDDTGVVVLIRYNKEIDISKLEVLVNDATLDPTTQTILTTLKNYVLQDDKKTIQLDLSSISTNDMNKPIKLYLSGIQDLKGNFTTPYVNEVYIATDTTTKPNAAFQGVTRTGKNTLTAKFSKSIHYPGYLTINNTMVYGTVDAKDKTCVNYNITGTLANATGYLEGTVSGWLSYNSIATGQTTKFTVDMSVGTTPPVLSGYQLLSTTNNDNTVVNSLVLTYSKDVVLTNATGTLQAIFQDQMSNIVSYQLIYAASVTDNVVTLVFDPSTVLRTGVYRISIPAYFIADSYNNYSEATTITVETKANAATQLPAPENIIQDPNNPSVLIVNFSKQVDLTSAMKTTNYTIDTVHPQSIDVKSNSSTGATIQLNFAPGAIPITANYPVYVEQISGVNGTYQPMQKYTKLMKLNENVAPVLLSAKLTGSTIVLTFSEKIQGTAAFNVYNYSTLVSLNSSQGYYIQDNKVTIILAQSVIGTDIKVMPATGCSILDLAGNPAILPMQITVTQ